MSADALTKNHDSTFLENTVSARIWGHQVEQRTKSEKHGIGSKKDIGWASINQNAKHRHTAGLIAQVL